MNWTCKHFNELSIHELYEIFRLRMEVFVVEQNCPYQDADKKDLESYHLMGFQKANDQTELVAYSRILPPGISFPEPSIGRVITSPNVRRTGTGRYLMQESISIVKEKYGDASIRIGAQSYLKKFYEGFGFVSEGEEYLEDGIPHREMVKKYDNIIKF